jgi:hypothetical protein
MQDLRVAFRSVVRAPLFSFLATLVIAFGIGLNTALLCLLYASLWKPLPYRDAGRLVAVGEIEEGRGFSPLTPANYADVREAATSFEAVTAHWYYELELGEVDPPERVQALYVLEGLFEFTGVPPAVGRALQEDGRRAGIGGSPGGAHRHSDDLSTGRKTIHRAHRFG